MPVRRFLLNSLPLWLWSKPWGPSDGPGPRGIPSLQYKHMVALRMGGTSAGSQECGGKQPKQVFWHRIFQKKKPKRQCKSRKVRVVLLSCQSPAPLWTCPSVKCGYANSIKPSPFQPLGPLGHSKSANLKVWQKKKKKIYEEHMDQFGLSESPPLYSLCLAQITSHILNPFGK